ncbi:GntR family transcriptional regulator [Pseudoclavibacter endophyticus]|uniref:GntR family transcriptional regulator n=1 Tax=Pseudoclavibacter endophyticus TaxID=1778590 RepID=A0A6H9WFF3_9MICO|nr:GntR family transcriptional regulator [Pseudoclavibacter endophyticus]KAB1646858.1 GntR family transcriptional regulator [Pseudoclavibacter endophyticus]
MQFDSPSPIWAQLEAEFIRRIVVGEWAPGARMPGVRELASTLGVNPNTAQRALAELERRGLCRSERTAGRFVTEDLGLIDSVRGDLVGGAADDFIERALGMRMSREAALRLIDERWNDHADHEQRPGARAGAAEHDRRADRGAAATAASGA